MPLPVEEPGFSARFEDNSDDEFTWARLLEEPGERWFTLGGYGEHWSGKTWNELRDLYPNGKLNLNYRGAVGLDLEESKQDD